MSREVYNYDKELENLRAIIRASNFKELIVEKGFKIMDIKENNVLELSLTKKTKGISSLIEKYGEQRFIKKGYETLLVINESLEISLVYIPTKKGELMDVTSVNGEMLVDILNMILNLN